MTALQSRIAQVVEVGGERNQTKVARKVKCSPSMVSVTVRKFRLVPRRRKRSMPSYQELADRGQAMIEAGRATIRAAKAMLRAGLVK